MDRKPAHISLIDSLEKAIDMYQRHPTVTMRAYFSCCLYAILTTEFPKEHLPAMCTRIKELISALPGKRRQRACNRTIRLLLGEILDNLELRPEEPKLETETKE